MNAKDQSKLCKAGYTILRKFDEPNPGIKHKTKDNPDSWRNFKVFKSKAERDREMNKLTSLSNCIED